MVAVDDVRARIDSPAERERRGGLSTAEPTVQGIITEEQLPELVEHVKSLKAPGVPTATLIPIIIASAEANR